MSALRAARKVTASTLREINAVALGLRMPRDKECLDAGGIGVFAGRAAIGRKKRLAEAAEQEEVDVLLLGQDILGGQAVQDARDVRGEAAGLHQVRFGLGDKVQAKVPVPTSAATAVNTCAGGSPWPPASLPAAARPAPRPADQAVPDWADHGSPTRQRCPHRHLACSHGDSNPVPGCQQRRRHCRPRHRRGYRGADAVYRHQGRRRCSAMSRRRTGDRLRMRAEMQQALFHPEQVRMRSVDDPD